MSAANAAQSGAAGVMAEVREVSPCAKAYMIALAGACRTY
jgi:hypothetical protein